jgi:hypothetical protein
MTVLVRLLVPFLWLAAGAVAQWINYPTPGTPRTKDGKPNLAAPSPKTRDGKPDLSGIWESLPPAKDIASHRWPQGAAGNGFDTADESDFDLENYLPDGAKITLTPAAEALFTQRIRGLGAGRPSGQCLPHSIPDAMLIPADFKIVQNPALTLILFEEFNHYRQIFTDGRPLPADPNPAWFGSSIGKWERDTFVVDTVGFNDRSWLDDHGHPHSDALHTTERYRRKDFGHMEMQLTVDDPKTYTAPWTATIQFRLFPDTDLIEDICENERDSRHEVGR